MPKPKREEAESFSKYERRKLQSLYTQHRAVCGSGRILVKASNLPVSKLEQFLHSKLSYTEFTLATRKFKRMKAFARFKNESWCMQLTYVDKLAEDKNGVKYLLLRQDLFDRTVERKRMKTKNSKQSLHFLNMSTKKKRPTKLRVDKGREFAGEFKKLCKVEGVQIYSTMTEAKVAFAARIIRSFKNIFHRYMEDYGYKYIQKLSQFVINLNSGKNCSIGLIPKKVKNSDFRSIQHGKPLRKNENPKVKVGDRIGISKYYSPFRKSYKSQLSQEFFEIVAISSSKPPTYTK